MFTSKTKFANRMSEHGDSIVPFNPTELRSGEPACKTDVLRVDLRKEKSNKEELKDIKKPYDGTKLLQDELNKDAKLKVRALEKRVGRTCPAAGLHGHLGSLFWKPLFFINSSVWT